jgi:hypothetical protein
MSHPPWSSRCLRCWRILGSGADAIIPITASQVLTTTTGQPLVVPPGDYLLKLVGDGTNGLCASTVLFTDGMMRYVLLGATNT